jgi:hypothetical protein
MANPDAWSLLSCQGKESGHLGRGHRAFTHSGCWGINAGASNKYRLWNSLALERETADWVNCWSSDRPVQPSVPAWCRPNMMADDRHAGRLMHWQTRHCPRRLRGNSSTPEEVDRRLGSWKRLITTRGELPPARLIVTAAIAWSPRQLEGTLEGTYQIRIKSGNARLASISALSSPVKTIEDLHRNNCGTRGDPFKSWVCLRRPRQRSCPAGNQPHHWAGKGRVVVRTGTYSSRA